MAGVATAVGLLLTANVGLFGYIESLSVPYAALSLAVEFTAAFVLLVGAVRARAGRAGPGGGQARTGGVKDLRLADNGSCGNLRRPAVR